MISITFYPLLLNTIFNCALWRAHSLLQALYTKSAEDRNAWIDALRKAAKTVPFETFYRLGRDLGKGHFSRVREATRIESNQKFAVKVRHGIRLSGLVLTVLFARHGRILDQLV